MGGLRRHVAALLAGAAGLKVDVGAEPQTPDVDGVARPFQDGGDLLVCVAVIGHAADGGELVC
jgi:hypothetical protein